MDGVMTKEFVFEEFKKLETNQQKAKYLRELKETKQKLVESEGQQYSRIQREQLNNYTTVAEKGYRELEGLHFDRAFDAVKAIDVGIKGQREVITGLINLQFVQDVLGILVEEIGDQDILSRVAVKLKTLVQNQKEVP